MKQTSKRMGRAGISPVIMTAAWLAATLAAELPAGATNYTLTVDASKQTTGSPRFWTASVGTGTASLTLRADLQTHYKLVNRELGMQRVRGHGVLNDDIGIYKAAGSYDFTKFDTYLTAIVSAGMRPIMELDFMPTALALTGSSRDFPKDINAYKAFITAVVQHCVTKYGAADVGQWYWEIWNEPDYPGFWNGTNASEATAAKMTDYYMLYDAAVSAITSQLPNALVGGPATTEPGPIGAFLQHCKSAGTRVTFASSHSYPGGDGTSPANATNLINDNNSRVSQITSGGYTTATVKSFNTEFNSAYSGQGGNKNVSDISMDSHVNAPFIIKGVKLFSDKFQGTTPPLDVLSYWVASDVFDESSGPSGSYILGQGGNLPFGQVFGLMTFQGVRKAAFNGYKMLNYLGTTRLTVAGGTTGDGVDGLAAMSASGDELQIIAYDYFATASATGTDNVTINVSNLPAALAGKSLFVTHFRVDSTHSNPYSVWVGQNSPTNPTEAQWQAMRQAQHLALLQPVAKTTVTTSFTTTFTHAAAGRVADHPGRESSGDRPQRPGRDRRRGLRRPVGRDQGDQQRHHARAVDCGGQRQLHLLRERRLQRRRGQRGSASRGGAGQYHHRAARRHADRAAHGHVRGDQHRGCLGHADLRAGRGLGCAQGLCRVRRDGPSQLVDVPAERRRCHGRRWRLRRPGRQRWWHRGDLRRNRR